MMSSKISTIHEAADKNNRMVRSEGVEPSRPKALVFETSVSTNSTTCALQPFTNSIGARGESRTPTAEATDF